MMTARISSMLLIAAVTSSGCSPAPDPRLASEVESVTKAQAVQAEQLRQLKHDIDALKSMLSTLQENSDAARASIDAMSTLTSAPIDSRQAATTATGNPASRVEHVPQTFVPPPGIVMKPGWIVEYIPMSYERMERGNTWVPGSVNVGRFIAPPSGFGFLDHRRLTRTKNHMGYKASGFFVAREAGSYVFSLALAQGKHETSGWGDVVGCDLSLTIVNSEVIPAQPLKITPQNEMSLFGNIVLEPGQYKTVLSAACPRFNYCCGENGDIARFENDLEKLRLKISVRQPEQPNPQPLSDQDLIHDEVEGDEEGA